MNYVAVLSLRLTTPFSGSLEELLIDFHELVGPHSGENMADIVWSTLELYRIQNKVDFTSFFP